VKQVNDDNRPDREPSLILESVKLQHEYANNVIRILLLINTGGVLILMTFISSTLDGKNNILIDYTHFKNGMKLFIFGVVFTAISGFCNFLSIGDIIADGLSEKSLSRLHKPRVVGMIFGALSVLMFIVACSVAIKSFPNSNSKPAMHSVGVAKVIPNR
jgi:hypothetical protein